jgi:uracil-DNA glycosylase
LTESSKTKLKKLQALERQIDACRGCPLHKTRTNTVPGGGNPDARILIIGEAPGANEDLTGQPFVGMAGKFLDKLLESAGIRRQDVFVTNINKCRPPDNRAPEPLEIDACASFLTKQMAILDPALIICLGSTAARAVLGLKQIGDTHGKLLERDGRMYFVAYHPAARFHRGKIAEDFKKLRRELRKMPELAPQTT